MDPIRGSRLLGIALLTLLAAGALILASPVRRGYDALLVLGDLVGAPLPRAVDVRPSATRRAIEFTVDGRWYQGDLYGPEGSPKAGIVFVPGAAERGKDDPRVVGFATALARARLAVLVPDLVALRELRLLPESARDIGDALTWMLARPDLAPAGRVGLVTTSVAIGPGVLALLDPPLSAAVRFVVAIGGYHDLPRTLGYLTTGHYAAHGVTLQRAPNEYGKWVYALSNAVRLDDERERMAFEALAWRKFRDPQADVSAERAELGPEGRQIYAFIVNTDATRSQSLIAGLPPRLRADLEALNLAAHDLTAIQARFILVHGIDDDMIPFGESIGLAQALAPGQARLFLLQGFGHVETAAQFADGWRLWRAIDALLRESAR